MLLNITGNSHTLPPLGGQVLWLIPGQPEYTSYEQEIRHLANHFSTPVFSPHVTLSGLPSLPVSKLTSRLDKLFFDVLPLKAKTRNISCNNYPYQKLIHEIPEHEPLYQIAKEVQRQINEADPKEDNFHLSLLYGTMDCENFKAEIPRLEQDLPQEISLSGYKIVNLAHNVNNWRTITSRTF